MGDEIMTSKSDSWLLLSDINAGLTNNNVKKIPPFIYHIYLKDVMLIIGSIQVLRVITSAQLSVHKIVQAIKY